MRGTGGHICAELLGTRLQFTTLMGLFSADRVDDGTRLLLDHLPGRAPKRVLDLGCGYGALGLPVAARYPDATCVLVDRDALAAEAARRNALANGLANVQAQPSLGYRDVAGGPFDWILCNVPARIGEAAVAYFLQDGARRLRPGGELRVVVIRDLAPMLEQLKARHGWPLRLCAEGARHRVYALAPMPAAPPVDPEAVYARDRVQLAGMELERPMDLSEEPGHLREGLPLLLELLPREPKGPTLVWRNGYGAASVALARKGAQVSAADRDLLATTATRRNAARAGVALGVREAFSLEAALGKDERFALLVGELHPSVDPRALQEEVGLFAARRARGGLALWLGLTRTGRKVMGAALPLASRGAYSVWRVG